MDIYNGGIGRFGCTGRVDDISQIQSNVDEKDMIFNIKINKNIKNITEIENMLNKLNVTPPNNEKTPIIKYTLHKIIPKVEVKYGIYKNEIFDNIKVLMPHLNEDMLMGYKETNDNCVCCMRTCNLYYINKDFVEILPYNGEKDLLQLIYMKTDDINPDNYEYKLELNLIATDIDRNIDVLTELIELLK
uniref:Uncharacterized protein n=1 Tax=Pithovirus LCPAC102 TaxID=2506587 RepID=A0A481Z445_9VIRU|nr:MAG: hypothetical protein LCPAC102_00610 [Pithovirus LCPAC102]